MCQKKCEYKSLSEFINKNFDKRNCLKNSRAEHIL